MPNLRRLPPAPSSPTGTVATFDTSVPGSYAWEPLPPPIHNLLRTGTTFFDPTDPTYGAKGDGVTDDTAAVQAAVNAAAVQGSGIILIPALFLLTGAITMPARGTYLFMGSGVAASQADNQDPYPTVRPGFVVPNSVSGNFGNQPSVIGQSNLMFFLFDCSNASVHSGQGELSIGFSNLLVNVAFPGSWNRPMCLTIITNHVRSLLIDSCEIWNAGSTYITGVGGGGQLDRVLIRDSSLHSGWIWGDGHGPIIGVIYDNIAILAGESFIPFPHGHFMEQNTFFTWQIHHNVLQSQGNALTVQRATIYIAGISQTNLGSITENTFYGADGGCIYFQDNNTGANQQTGGLVIADNEFIWWNLAARNGNAGSAIFIDHTTAATPEQIVSIGGPQNFQGDNVHSLFGITVVDNPDTAFVDLNLQQNMKSIVTAPFSVGGVSYGGAGNSGRMHGSVVVPAFSSGVAKVNPFGFDVMLYLTAVSACTVVQDGQTLFTIPAAGIAHIAYPRQSSLTLTAAPTMPTIVGTVA